MSSRVGVSLFSVSKFKKLEICFFGGGFFWNYSQRRQNLRVTALVCNVQLRQRDEKPTLTLNEASIYTSAYITALMTS